jgi:hypothetical protein
MHYVLFVDSENLPASVVPDILQRFDDRGDTFEARVYSGPVLSSAWQNVIAREGWDLVRVRRIYGGDQAVDMAMSLDMIDTFHVNKTHGIALASGDSDFLPVLLRIRSHGGSVLVITDPAETAKTVLKLLHKSILPVSKRLPSPRPVDQSVVMPAQATPPAPPQDISRHAKFIRNICINTFRTHVADTKQLDMPILKIMAALQRADIKFNTRKYGFNNISDLVMSVGIFTLIDRAGEQPHKRWCVSTLQKEQEALQTEQGQLTGCDL